MLGTSCHQFKKIYFDQVRGPHDMPPTNHSCWKDLYYSLGKYSTQASRDEGWRML